MQELKVESVKYVVLIFMSQIILHIPHSSRHIPFYDGYVVSKDELDAEILKLTDWYTDELFSFEMCTNVKADFSRIFCDVERFSDDESEEMAKFGMGMIYTKLDDGRALRVVSDVLRELIYEEYYLPHHEKLSLLTEEQLQNSNTALIVDCHSFSDTPFNRDLNQSAERPQICIGTDEYHTPKGLAAFAKEYFESKSYTCKFNSPYGGSIVPPLFYKKDKRVSSIMIELNRDLYLQKGTNRKNKEFSQVKADIFEFIRSVDVWSDRCIS